MEQQQRETDLANLTVKEIKEQLIKEITGLKEDIKELR
ncbi:hypothetical protein ACVW0P_004515 [Mucilaginibacter sp. UYNi724]